MKIYTTYTPSHSILYEQYFLKTLPDSFDLVVFEDNEQLCKSGIFRSDGWTKTTKKKVDIFVNACIENFGKYFFYCDVDTQFFSNDIENILLQELGDFDIACQEDMGYYNSGVFVCYANDRTLNMFKNIQQNYNYQGDDQDNLNAHIKSCKCKMLSRKFFTTGFECGIWKGQDFTLPKNIAMHHANWVVGIENKIKVLDMVKYKYEFFSR